MEDHCHHQAARRTSARNSSPRPRFDQGAIDREVVVRQERLDLGGSRMPFRNFLAISASSSRSRFFD
jgi:hypothetical protein